MSRQIRYTVSAGEGCCCGPVFGPSSAVEIFEILDKDGPGSLILQIEEPFAINSELVSYVVVTPRYTGDTLKMLREKGCIVNIAKVLPNRLDQLMNGDEKGATEYLAVGECKRELPETAP